MAKITGQVDVTPQDESLLNATFLPAINAERVAQKLAPFANMDAYATFVLQTALSSYVSGEKKKKQDTVAGKYINASDAVKAQVDALLG